MDEKTDKGSEKKKSKIFILIMVLCIVLVGIIIGIILIISNQYNKNVTYNENPTVFCQNNPEHILCSDEEISYWDDPVNFCLKYPEDSGCEKTGDVDYCKNNPSSVICDNNPDNDYDWIDDYLEDAFSNFGLDDESANAYRDVFSDSMKELSLCLNNAGLHIDSLDSYEALSSDDTNFDIYNDAQILKIQECNSNFGDLFGL